MRVGRDKADCNASDKLGEEEDNSDERKEFQTCKEDKRMSGLKTVLRSAWADQNISHRYSGFLYLQMISLWQEEWKLAVLCH